MDDTQYEIFDIPINFFMMAVTLTTLGLEGIGRRCCGGPCVFDEYFDAQ